MNPRLVRAMLITIAVSFVLLAALLPPEVLGKKGIETAFQPREAPQQSIGFKLTPDPLWVAPDSDATMTITIGAAQTTDTVILLSSSAPEIMQVPASVTIPAFQTSRKFTVSGVALGLATISATPPVSLNTLPSKAMVSVRPRSNFNGLQYYPLPQPIRFFDSRVGASACVAPQTPLLGGVERTEKARITCQGAVIPSNATAVVGNATVVNFYSGPGFVTLYPSDVTNPTVSNLNYRGNQIIANNFTVGLGPDGAFKMIASTKTDLIIDIAGYYAPPNTGDYVGLYYHPLPHPIRLLDTRPGEPACDAPGMPLVGNQARPTTARRQCDGLIIPDNALAIVGNATVVNFLSAGGYITLYPSGVQQPAVSNINYGANQIIPNGFVVGLGNDGAFNVFAGGATHFIVDVTGYFSTEQAEDANGSAGLLYIPLPRPVRLLDTRPGSTACTAPGAALQGGVGLIQNTTVSCESIPIEAAARTIVGNGTVVNTFSDPGYIRLWPNGTPQPAVSNMNYLANQIIANGFTVGLSVNGQFNIVASSATHFIADVTGYFAQ